MYLFKLEMETDSTSVLDRIIEAYGFGSKVMLAEHFNLAASSVSARYRRGGFPADLAVQCMAETGATLEWLATGQGKKFDSEKLDILKISNHKLIDGTLHQAGFLMLDKIFFGAGIRFPEDPISVLEDKTHYIIDRKFADIYDDNWLVNIEGKISIRLLTRIPVKRVRVSGIGMVFDCDISEISILGRVIGECKIHG